MNLTNRQEEVIRSYAKAERDNTIPDIVLDICAMNGHAHGMALWGLNRVLRNLEKNGLMTSHSKVTTEGHFWLLLEGYL